MHCQFIPKKPKVKFCKISIFVNTVSTNFKVSAYWRWTLIEDFKYYLRTVTAIYLSPCCSKGGNGVYVIRI